MGLMVTGVFMIASVTKDHWIRAFYLWCATLSCLVYSLTISRYAEAPLFDMHLQSLDFMLKISVGMMVYVAATRIHDVERALDVLCAFTVFQCGVYIFQMSGLDIIRGMSNFTGGRMVPMAPAGTLGNPNFFASVLAITSPLFLRGKWKYFLLLTMPVLLMQRTSGAVIATVVAFVYIAVQTRIKFWYMIFPVIAVSLFVFWTYLDVFEFDSFRERTWLAMIMGWKSWWLIGNSPGSFPIFAKVEHAHNEYLEIAYETGMVGVICYMGFGITLLKNALKAKGVEMLVIASLICLGVYAFFHYPLHLAPSGFIALVLMGVYTGGRLQDVR